MLLLGTGCYWRSNFGKVIEPLANILVACVSYDGFDETRTDAASHDDRGDGKDRGKHTKEHYDGENLCSVRLLTRRVIRWTYGGTRSDSYGLWYSRRFGSGSIRQNSGKLMTSLDAADDLSVSTTGRFRLSFLNP